jgi:hypothetical protein
MQEPTNLLDVSLSKLTVQMIYSHDVLPTIAWAGICYLLGLFKNQKLLYSRCNTHYFHALTGYIAEYPHNIFGSDSMSRWHGVVLFYLTCRYCLSLLLASVCCFGSLQPKEKTMFNDLKGSRNWFMVFHFQYTIHTFNCRFIH